MSSSPCVYEKKPQSDSVLWLCKNWEMDVKILNITKARPQVAFVCDELKKYNGRRNDSNSLWCSGAGSVIVQISWTNTIDPLNGFYLTNDQRN